MSEPSLVERLRKFAAAEERLWGGVSIVATLREAADYVEGLERAAARPAAIVLQDFGVADAFEDVSEAEDYAEISTHEKAFEVVEWRWHPAKEPPP